MYFYEVFVAEPRYQKREPLTYHSPEKLKPGAVVSVPYGNRTVGGFVASVVQEPSFSTKQIEARISDTSLPKPLLTLHRWLLDYYPSGSGATTQLFIPSGLPAKRRLSFETADNSATLPKLTTEQAAAAKAIKNSSAYVIHGETGSGKTRLYIEQALQCIAAHKSVIILTPEISLIPQLQDSLQKVFGSRVVELHSGLTKATRNKHWQSILESSEPLVVVGTRSALFAPVSNIGLIVVDEMHEPAYKQDAAPRYHALRAAAKRARIEKATILYGSATPPIVEYYIAEQTKTPILRLSKSARATSPVQREIIDLKDKSLFSRHNYLSDTLLGAIDARLARSEQSLLFLNRRGTARQVLCKECGWQALCPKCDLPLTFHADTHQMRCHTCGYHDRPPYACPECHSSEILYRSLGTKALADDLARLFPEARIRRFDTDNLTDESLSRTFADVQSGEIQILVGTQMLGKGLDLPHLSLVGIVNADTALHMPDFSSAERSYQLLHQAIGRVGRGHKNGEVIVQTYQPDDTLLTAALYQQWKDLYTHELAERQLFRFPPFCYLLKITVSRRKSEAAERYIQDLRRQVVALNLPLEIETPSPSFYERSHGNFNWQLVIKAKSRQPLVDVVTQLPAGDYVSDLDPINLL